MSIHCQQVASVLRRAVQEVLSRGLNDPRVRGLISVTNVRVSEDLADATVSVSIMPAADAELTVRGLRHAARHIRTQVGRRVKLRRTPHLTFKLDETLKREAKVIAAVNEAVRDDREARSFGEKQNPQGEESQP